MKTKAKPIPFTSDELKEIFTYRDGRLYWIKSPNNRAKSGSEAGCFNKGDGYRQIQINKIVYKTHRLIWVLFNGEITDLNLEIDHKNAIKDDNRIENLRLVSRSGNMKNQRKAKGYTFHKKAGKWVSSIKVSGKRIHLGLFDSRIDARIAYLAAKKIHHVIKEY